MTGQIHADSFADQAARDPHTVFARMRERDPIQWHAPTASWYVTSYALVTDLLRERTLSARLSGHAAARDVAASARLRRLVELFDSWMVFSDPPHQTRLRDAVADGFLPRAARAWAECARSVTEQALPTADGDVVEVDRVSTVIATRLTCAVLGVPVRDEHLVRGWSADLIGFLATPSAEPARTAVAAEAVEKLDEYWRTVVSPRLAEDDRLAPLRGMIGLDHHSALALFTQLLTGGIDPVASTLTTAMHLLLGSDTEHGDVDAIVEEALRFDAPFHFVPRTATAELRIGGHTVPEGARVVLVIAAANRDPAVYEDPDAFRPGRPGPPHLAFGLGGHYCLGASLARVLLRESIGAVLRWSAGRRPRVVEATRTPAFGATTWQRLAVWL
ncbi:cytochrome P450 [Actinophytocola oryzae]|uniref:Cytochrome P450 n=1 Tax=Actinophytocola oryzae TaxID=502181 RepID=A0A4R7VH93_9PSEU|nr:cytochrome P450 [Actinophytocola oryzae]TDV48692.1 hypothetical protein CLV71_10852 [Actinophytocola oryzae]